MAKATILYVGQPVMFAHAAWAQFEQDFNVLMYDLHSKAEVIEAFSEGGKYSKIDGIVRPNLAPNMLPPLDKELISHLPATCKIISYCNHGYDGEDTEELGRRGVWYCNGAGGATESTADIALFLILATFRYTTFCELTVREKKSADWFHVEDMCSASHEPSGKVLGVIGMGDIGAAAAKRAMAIGMTIHYYNRRRKPSLEIALGNAVYHETVDSLLAVSDCVLVACPHTPQTHHVLNRETFKLMKTGSRVVNIGRGKCIDEDSLASALEKGHISSAGLDVFHDEPVIHPKLLANWKVTLLPHMAGGTLDANRKFEEIAMKNIDVYFLGDGKPLTPVNQITTFDIVIDEGYRGPSKVHFDPKVHLNYDPPPRIYTMSEFGLSPSLGTSDFAVTEPFQLATDAAVVELRRELLQENTVKRRMHWWHRSPACLRGFTKEEAPFTHAFWTSPETINIFQQLTGIELEVSLPYEIGHTNVQVGHGGRDGIKDLKVKPEPVPEGWKEKKGEFDAVPVDNWHVDSFPYSAVIMLSNTDKMVGGETAVQLPDGSVKKIRGTAMGSATFIQGRHLRHAALRAGGTGERIAMVCPYRAKHPALRDDTEITNSLQLSYLNELFAQFALERFRVLKKKSEYMIDSLEKGKKDALVREPDNYDAVWMDKDEVKNMMTEMIRYLNVAMDQMGMNELK